MSREKLALFGTFLLAFAAAAGIALRGRAADRANLSPNDGGIEVAIALPHSPFQNEIDVPLAQDRHFPVVITNTSGKPINFLAENNSWGDVALSFDAVDEKGVHYHIKKIPMGWDDNSETYWVLQPGEHLVIDVYFGGTRQRKDTWTGFPDIHDTKSCKMALTAIFESNLEKGDRGAALWHGRCASAPLDCVLRDLRK